MNRGDVYLANLDNTIGSEQAGERPVIIISSDLINRYSKTLVGIPTTKNLERAKIPGCVLLRQGDGGLYLDSVALCYQIRVFAKERFIRRLGTLSGASIKKIEEALRITLEL